jgi:hypothetical protein
LGHALWYQRDPVGYLQHCTKTLGPIFRLNMAGKKMSGIGEGGEGGKRNSQDGVSILKQLATMPESILSARQAVADIGFEQTLGWLNVHEGTLLHKGYNMMQQQQQQYRVGNKNIWIEGLQKALW